MSDVCPDCGRPLYGSTGVFPPDGCLDPGANGCLRAQLEQQHDRIRALESELAELRKSEAAALEESAVWRRDAVRYEKERDAALHELAELRKHGEGFLVAGACACDLLERILDGEVAAERRVAVAMAAKLRSALAAWVAAAQSPRPEPERRDAMEEVPQRPPVIPCKTQSHRLGKPCARCGWEHPDDAMRRRDDTARLQANAAARALPSGAETMANLRRKAERRDEEK